MTIKELHKLTLFSFLIGIVLLVSCDNDFDLSYDVPSKPVVYAIIDPDDPVHYLRVGRTFNGSDNAFLSAQIADSICYNNLQPRLEFYTREGWMYKSFAFSHFENTNKDDGIFSKLGLQSFQLKADLKNLFIENSYLVLNMGYSDSSYITSQVPYIEPPRTIAPKQGINSLFDFYYPFSFTFKFQDPPEFSKYQVHFRLFYTNVHLDGYETHRFADKIFYRNSQNDTKVRTKSHLTLQIDGDVLLAKYGKAIPEDKTVDYRLFDQIHIILMTGSPVFYDNLDLQKMSDDYGGGVISNIIGGYGVFTLKHEVKLTNILFGALTMDSLINGRFTKELGFRYN